MESSPKSLKDSSNIIDILSPSLPRELIDNNAINWAIQLLNELVERALDVPEERIPTKVPRSAKENRLQEKGFIKDKKEGRKKVEY